MLATLYIAAMYIYSVAYIGILTIKIKSSTFTVVKATNDNHHQTTSARPDKTS